MLKKILIAVLVLVAGFLVVAALQPSDLRVSRSATMSAPAAAVFAQVNDFHRWEAWSPWAKLDPQAKNSYEGPPAGPGAVFRWAGNREVGEGSMTITDSQPNERIRIKLDFVKPFAGTNDVEFTFQPQGDQTQVSWTMSGKKNLLMKAMGLFVSCDKMIGGRFEEGLAQLKKIVE
ncbi:MAG: SRPBCC family protein [bacterium]